MCCKQSPWVLSNAHNSEFCIWINLTFEESDAQRQRLKISCSGIPHAFCVALVLFFNDQLHVSGLVF